MVFYGISAKKAVEQVPGLSHEKRVEIAKREQQETQAEKDQSLTVRKSNQLIQKNRFDMTLREQRLLLYCISKIKPTDKGEETYTISIRDVCAACGIADNVTGGAYKAMREAVKKLDSFNFFMKDVDGRDHLVHWIGHVVIDPERKKRACIQFNFDPRIVPYLFDVKKRFTSYELGNVMQMQSVYGIRLYELSKSYEFRGGHTFTLEEIRYLMGAEEESYKRYSNLKQKIIEPAIKEVNSFSDLKVDYVEIKEGRKVTGLKFVISSGWAEKAERHLEQLDKERHPERYRE